MAIPLEKRLLNTAEYHKMAAVGILSSEDRVELLNGELIKMSPINSIHANCVDQLTKWFLLQFHDKAVIRTQNPVTLDELSEPEPDLLLAKIKAEGYKLAHPSPKEVFLLIEVSDSTLDKDRLVKLPLYAEFKIPEVWIVNLVDKCVEIYTQPESKVYSKIEVFQLGDTIYREWAPGLVVSSIF